MASRSGLRRIPGSAEKCFNLQILLDPFEKEFELPTLAIQLGTLEGGQVKAINEKIIGLAGFGIVIDDPAEILGITIPALGELKRMT